MLGSQRVDDRLIQARELEDPSHDLGLDRAVHRPRGWSREPWNAAIPSRGEWLECELLHHPRRPIAGSHCRLFHDVPMELLPPVGLSISNP